MRHSRPGIQLRKEYDVKGRKDNAYTVQYVVTLLKQLDAGFFLKLTERQVFLDWKNISKTIFRKGLFLYFERFFPEISFV